MEDQKALFEQRRSGLSHEKHVGGLVQRLRLFLLPPLLLLGLTLVAPQARATTYTVKGAGGGNYTSIQACSNVAVAGDTCVIYSGSYAGWTQSRDGSTGQPITFKANAGDTVTITSGITLTNRAYITIGGPASNEGFSITATVAVGHNQYFILQNNTITSSGACVSGPGNNTNPSGHVYVLHNIIGPCGSGASEAYQDTINYALWDGNTFFRVRNGPQVSGEHQVLRNNHFGPIVLNESGTEHPDAVELSYYDSSKFLPVRYMVYEHNVIQDWDDENGHGLLMRNTLNGDVRNNILRFSTFVNIGSMSAVIDTNERYTYVYNNSISHMNTRNAIGYGIYFINTFGGSNGSTYGRLFNNILYDNATNTGNPWCYYVDSTSATGFTSGGNLCWQTGKTTWNTPGYVQYAASDIFNQDPQFVDPWSNLQLQAGSAAIGKGVALTAVASSDTGTGTSLAVNDAGFFQDGAGGELAGVYPDWIRVGPSTIVQIASINYATNTITLASSISRSAGDPVYLYKDSEGTVVLTKANPDIGGNPYQSGGGTAPAPPSGVTAIVN